MADIFISYKREDRPHVERLATTLRGLGFDVWFDASLSAGESFSDEIDREVRGAKVVLVCWSPAATTSQWVKAEAQVGFAKGNLVSAYVAGPDGFDAPVPFNALHVEDLRQWTVRPSARDPAWLSVLRRMGGLSGRLDVAEWGALGGEASAGQLDAWLKAHGATSPLVIEAESFLREREAHVRERQSAEEAARERIARLQAEKAVAETEARAAQAQVAWIRPQRPFANAARFWERARIYYNLAIAAVISLRTLAQYVESGSFRSPDWVWVLALLLWANVLFCAAYPADAFVQASPWRDSLGAFRRFLAALGIAIGVAAPLGMSLPLRL